jgi:acetate kinase
MDILVINCGSSSLKYQLIDMDKEEWISKGVCERIGIGGHISGKTADGRKFGYDIEFPDHTSAFFEVKKILTHGEYKVIDDLSAIHAVGHRIVQGGATFNESCIVTPEVEAGIERLCDLAPLHNAAHLQGIRASREVFGDKMPQVVVFDNAFHSTMPPKAYMFPLTYDLYKKYKIRKYGFHGTSHRFVSAECAKVMNRPLTDLKLITCHLGNGSSMAAIKGGKVIDTTMGLTPLDGLEMGSRCGAVDPSAITYVMEKENMSPSQMSEFINKKCGVLGISGISSDMRDVEDAAVEGNERATLALEILEYQIIKYIGAYTAAMNGLDAIVFTGGVGENSFIVRGAVCKQLSYFGVAINMDLNNNSKGKFVELSTPASKVKVYVIPTNEELVIARDTLRLTTK